MFNFYYFTINLEEVMAFVCRFLFTLQIQENFRLKHVISNCWERFSFSQTTAEILNFEQDIHSL